MSQLAGIGIDIEDRETSGEQLWRRSLLDCLALIGDGRINFSLCLIQNCYKFMISNRLDVTANEVNVLCRRLV